ncbi:MAG: L,D-transpeptidase [Campylobacterales bacterium]|nr:L,D-transpeptidase [Campylobacterales bacterium]
MRYKFLIFSAILGLIISGCSQKKPYYGEVDKTPYEIKECLNELAHGKDIKQARADKIVVHKSEKKLYLYKDGKVIGESLISMGKNWDKGTKVKQGDYRTPEGTYTIVRKKCDPRLYRNLLISFPNAQDIARAKALGHSTPGGLITIHGQPKWNADGRGDKYTLANDWTEGCIALPNSTMQLLWESVALGVPIEIYP